MAQRFRGFQLVVDLVDSGEQASALLANGEYLEDLFRDFYGRGKSSRHG